MGSQNDSINLARRARAKCFLSEGAQWFTCVSAGTRCEEEGGPKKESSFSVDGIATFPRAAPTSSPLNTRRRPHVMHKAVDEGGGRPDALFRSIRSPLQSYCKHALLSYDPYRRARGQYLDMRPSPLRAKGT